MTTLEVEMEQLTRVVNMHIARTDRLIDKLDARADRQDILMARIFAGLVIAGALGQVFAPVIRTTLGLPG